MVPSDGSKMEYLWCQLVAETGLDVVPPGGCKMEWFWGHLVVVKWSGFGAT